MEHQQHEPAAALPLPNNATTPPSATSEDQPAKHRIVVLVRHGQATFNVEGRHPGQLPGIPLTEDGRRQAHAAAVALAAMPVSAVVASPLERAFETARIIARGWGLEVRTDPRLMDTNIGPYAGKKLSELKDDAGWRAFAEKPHEPPPDVEGHAAVAERALAVMHEILADHSLGPCVVLVSHADVVKLILAHYLGSGIGGARYIGVANASLSTLVFHGDDPPQVLAVNWEAVPRWLVPPLPTPASTAAVAEEPATSLPMPDEAAAPAADVAPADSQRG